MYVGCGVSLLQVVPLFASWCATLLPEIPMCALTFYILVLSLVNIN